MSQEQLGAERVLAIFRRCMPVFLAMGEQARQDIVLALSSHNRLNVGQIAAQSTLSRPAISHHLKVLRDAGVLNVEREGTENYYSLNVQFLLGELKALVSAIEASCSK